MHKWQLDQRDEEAIRECERQLEKTNREEGDE